MNMFLLFQQGISEFCQDSVYTVGKGGDKEDRFGISGSKKDCRTTESHVSGVGITRFVFSGTGEIAHGELTLKKNHVNSRLPISYDETFINLVEYTDRS